MHLKSGNRLNQHDLKKLIETKSATLSISSTPQALFEFTPNKFILKNVSSIVGQALRMTISGGIHCAVLNRS